MPDGGPTYSAQEGVTMAQESGHQRIWRLIANEHTAVVPKARLRTASSDDETLDGHFAHSKYVMRGETTCGVRNKRTAAVSKIAP